MDTGNKTLAQLSEEGKEAKYVTLEVGSKLSGYTKEYLERLCSMRKVDYLLWNNEQHVIELKSLLNETHTILLSYEGLTFVDKAGLSVPPHEPIPFDMDASDGAVHNESFAPLRTPIPHFAEQGRLRSRDASVGTFSFTGRAVVSDSRHPENAKDDDTRIPVLVFNEEVVAAQAPVLVHTNTPSIEAQIPESQSHAKPMRTALHIPIIQSREPAASPPITQPVLPYHPIQTSVDATLHHETLPLFPELLDKNAARAIVAPDTKEDIVAIRTNTAPSSTPPPRVVTVSTSLLPEPLHPLLPSVRTQSQVPMSEPNNLPQRAQEHHLLVPDAHPLMKSVGFNMAFALLFVVPAFLVFSGTVANNANVFPTGEMNLAAIGTLAAPQRELQESTLIPPTRDATLEFSDEVVVTSGDTPNSVLVQPIFREGAGMVHEYTNARIEDNELLVQ